MEKKKKLYNMQPDDGQCVVPLRDFLVGAILGFSEAQRIFTAVISL